MFSNTSPSARAANSILACSLVRVRLKNKIIFVRVFDFGSKPKKVTEMRNNHIN